MRHATTEIHAGVCGFVTQVRAVPAADDTVELQIESDCDKIRALAQRLDTPVDPLHEIQAGHDGVVLTAARNTLSGCCSGCVVPAGIFKSVQVAGRLALPRDISIVIKDTAT